MSEKSTFDSTEDPNHLAVTANRPDMSFVRKLSNSWAIGDDIGDCSYVVLRAMPTAYPKSSKYDVGYVELRVSPEGLTRCSVAHNLNDPRFGSSGYEPYVLARDLEDPLAACALLEEVNAIEQTVRALQSQSTPIDQY